MTAQTKARTRAVWRFLQLAWASRLAVVEATGGAGSCGTRTLC